MFVQSSAHAGREQETANGFGEMNDLTEFEYLVKSAVTRRYLKYYSDVDPEDARKWIWISDCVVFTNVAHSMIYYSPLLQKQLATAKNQKELAQQDLAVRLVLCRDARLAIPLPAAIAHEYNQTRQAVKDELAVLGRKRAKKEAFYFFRDSSGNMHATYQSKKK